MADDNRTPRARAVAQLDDPGTPRDENARCGPEPERPTYFSPQTVRDKWYAWKECRALNG